MICPACGFALQQSETVPYLCCHPNVTHAWEPHPTLIGALQRYVTPVVVEEAPDADVVNVDFPLAAALEVAAEEVEPDTTGGPSATRGGSRGRR